MTAGRKFLFSLLVAAVGMALVAFVARLYSRYERPHSSHARAIASASPAARLVKAIAKPTESNSLEESDTADAPPPLPTAVRALPTAAHVLPPAAETPVDPHESSSFLLDMRGKMGSPLQGTVFSSTPQDAAEIRNEFVDHVRQLESASSAVRARGDSAADSPGYAPPRTTCSEKNFDLAHASCREIDVLRTSAEELDRMAQQLERSDLFETADRIREAAKDLRLAARSIAVPESAVHAPLVDPTR